MHLCLQYGQKSLLDDHVMALIEPPVHTLQSAKQFKIGIFMRGYHRHPTMSLGLTVLLRTLWDEVSGYAIELAKSENAEISRYVSF